MIFPSSNLYPKGMFLFFKSVFTVLSCDGFGQFKTADQLEDDFRSAHHDCRFSNLIEQILVKGCCRFVFIEDALQFLEFIELFIALVLGEFLFAFRSHALIRLLISEDCAE